jgi:hypothetical protein
MVKHQVIDLTKSDSRGIDITHPHNRKGPRHYLLSDVPGNKVLESGIRGMIVDYLRIKGWLVWVNWQGPFSYPGIPDLTAVRNGVTVWIEVKKPGGRLSADQKKFREDIEDYGGNWLLATCIEDIQSLCERRSP